MFVSRTISFTPGERVFRPNDFLPGRRVTDVTEGIQAAQLLKSLFSAPECFRARVWRGDNLACRLQPSCHSDSGSPQFLWNGQAHCAISFRIQVCDDCAHGTNIIPDCRREKSNRRLRSARSEMRPSRFACFPSAKNSIGKEASGYWLTLAVICHNFEAHENGYCPPNPSRVTDCPQLDRRG